MDGTTRGLLFSQTSFALRGSSVRTKVTPASRTQKYQQSHDHNAGFYVAIKSRGHTTSYAGAHLHSGCNFVADTSHKLRGASVGVSTQLHSVPGCTGGDGVQWRAKGDGTARTLGTQCLVSGRYPCHQCTLTPGHPSGRRCHGGRRCEATAVQVDSAGSCLSATLQVA